MRATSALTLSSFVLLASGLVNASRADEAFPDAAIDLRGDATFKVELKRRETPVCGEDWDFAFQKKSADFKLVWIGDGIERRHFVLKTEVWRHSLTGQCEYADLVDRMDVSVFDARSVGKAAPLYALSIAPEEHDESDDLAIVETVGPFLKLYTGERDGRADYFENPGGPYRYYDLVTGKLLFLADEWRSVAELTVKGAEAPSRFIGVTVRRGPIFAESEESKSGYIATVTYASRGGILQQAKILGSPTAIRYDELDPRIVFIGGNVYGGELIGGEASKAGGEMIFRATASEAETFNGGRVRIILAESVYLDIPLASDRLDFAAATSPAGVKVSPMN
jgi:hypothetical protein